MEIKRPSPSGQLFDVSATTVKRLEALALTLGMMVDEIRSLTMRPLSATQRETVIAALRELSQFDKLAGDVEHRLREIQRLGRHLANLVEEDKRGHTI